MGDYADMAWDPCDPCSWIDLRRPYRGPQVKTCRRCGERNLFWHQHEGKWRLHTFSLEEGEYELHECSPQLPGSAATLVTATVPSADPGRNNEPYDL